MLNKKPLGLAALFACIALAFVSFGLGSEGAAQAKKQLGEQRADIIVIDSMAALGKLDLPSVTFKHDQHTEALLAQGKDCTACHLELEGPAVGKWSYKFKRQSDTTYAEVKEIYHNGCLSCHQAEAEAGRPSGPQAAECRSCHVSAPSQTAARQDVDMDKYLHYTHISSSNIAVAGQKDNCAACHHSLSDDGKKQPLRRAEKKEESCSACHMAAPVKNQDNPNAMVPALETVSHESCITCHFTTAAKAGKDKSGPYNCAGCHGQEAQAALAAKKKADVPRLDRGQPDSVMMLAKPGSAMKVQEVTGTMSPVAFNHKSHEAATDNCSTCHHAKIAACSSCHTLEGSKEGNFVNLERAMHKVDSNRSCAGCHNTYTQSDKCAGCHASMPVVKSQQSCAACHTTPVGLTDVQARDGSLLKMNKDLLERMAASTVSARKTNRAVINTQDIPEKVTIGVLANEYKPSVLPHRKIVLALEKGMADSELAQSFHINITTMCQGCHHNSPASLTPPKCASCHSVNEMPGQTGRPALKVAYHAQCMGCHSLMKVQKPVNTDCAGCHELAK